MSSTAPLNLDQTTRLAEMLRVMGEANRLRIVLACLEQQRTVGELANGLTLSPSLVSQHLRHLRTAHILKRRREGKHVYYTAADQKIRSMVSDLSTYIASG